MSTIFISHSSKDNEIAREVAERLSEQNHHSVFLDLDPEKGIVGGQSWERTLYRKLRACRAVIALCTDHYLSSQWCFAEVALARMEGKHIFAMKVDPLDPSTRMPAILADRQFIDLRSDAEDGYRRLWRGLKESELLGVAGEWDPSKSPYLGLSAFHEEHAPVFFGREDETRVGLELLERGAPGLIMVLGASGSGKSSLVRAGIVPRLRRDPSRWLVLDPFRPGNDPFSELSLSIERAYRRYAPDHGLDRTQIQRTLTSRPRRGSDSLSRVSAQFGLDISTLDQEDGRVSQLIDQLEALRESPPAYASHRLQSLLDESLRDLKQILAPADAQPGEELVRPALADPLVGLLEGVRQHAEGRREARVLLVVDQFEELLGYAEYADPANQFLTLLRRAVEAPFSPLTVVGTMRSDFLGQFQRNPSLLGVDFESLSVGPMGLDGMRRVIERPAQLGAIELGDGLTDRLLEDTETSDALPMLSFTLWKMWRDFRSDGALTVPEYESIGGLQGALAGEADAILERARVENRVDQLRVALLQLARITEDGAYARRSVPWNDPRLKPVHDLLDRFVKRRLLVVTLEGSDRHVEVAHEALFRSWTPLTTWLDNHRAELLLLSQLRRDAVAWEERGKNDDALWRGGRLQQAHELSRRETLLPGELNFVRAGVVRRQRQRWIITGVTAAVMTGLAGAALFSFQQKVKAEDEEARAMDIARVATAGQWLARDPNVAALVLSEVARPDRTPFASARMREALEAGMSVVLEGHEARVLSARFSPDGSRIVTASGDGTARIFSVDGRTTPVVLDPYPDDIADDVRMVEAEFSPDGNQVITASVDGTARVWNLRDSNQPARVLEHDLPVTAARFSPDGQWVVTASEDRTARIWPVNGSQEPVVLSGHDTFVVDVDVSPDGRLIATASHDGTARLWTQDGSNVVVLRGHTAEVMDVEFSPDGSEVVTASMDGTIRLWNLDGTTASVLRGHDGPVTCVSFDHDGSRVVSASRDGTARIWTLGLGEESIVLEHADTVFTAMLSPDGERVVTASNDGTARTWRASDGAAIFTFPWHAGAVLSAVFAPDGRRVVTASADGSARVWNPEGRDDPRSLGRAPNSLEVAATSLDGHWVAGAAGGDVLVWPAEDPQSIVTVGRQPRVFALNFTPDANVVASADDNGSVRLWQTDGGGEVSFTWLESRPAAIAYNFDGSRAVLASMSGDITMRSIDGVDSVLVGSQPDVVDAVFSPDNGRFLTASYDGSIVMWNAVQNDSVWSRRFDAPIVDLTFSPDGDLLIASTDGNVAYLMRSSSGDVVLSLTGHTGSITSTAFDSSGSRALTTSRDGSARIWGTDGTGEPVILRNDETPIVAGWFGGGADDVYTISSDGSYRHWINTTADQLRAALRASTNECLTVEFRQQFLGESPVVAAAHADTCSVELSRLP